MDVKSGLVSQAETHQQHFRQKRTGKSNTATTVFKMPFIEQPTIIACAKSFFCIEQVTKYVLRDITSVDCRYVRKRTATITSIQELRELACVCVSWPDSCPCPYENLG